MMSKYLGIIKIVTWSQIGADIQLKTKVSDSLETLEEWKKIYPGTESIILESNDSLESFFFDFDDFTLVTKEQKENARRMYKELMESED